VLDLRELAELGVLPSTVRTWVQRGRLHPHHEGVYSIGHADISPRGRRLAAVKACGSGALLSHVSAAVLWELLNHDDLRRVHVTVLNRSGRRRPGIAIHRPRIFVPETDLAFVDGICVTSVARTLMDLAAVVDFAALRRAVRQAEYLGLIDRPTLLATAERMGKRRGARNLRLVAGAPRVRSDYERRFSKICDRACARAGVPLPVYNGTVNGVEVDCHWPTLRLIIEVDPAGTHDLAANLESDPRRDINHAIGLWRTHRVTGARIDLAPEELEEDLFRLLSALNVVAPETGPTDVS